MAILRGQVDDLMRAKGTWNYLLNGEEYDRPEDYAEKLFNRIDTSKKDESFTEIYGLDRMVQANEYGALNYDYMGQLNDKKFEPLPYNLATIISREAWDNDQTGQLKKYAPLFKNSHFETVQILAHAVINGGFATTTTADGKYLFATDHTTANSTSKNKLSTAADLAVTSLQQMMIDGRGVVDHRGKKLNLIYDELWIPPELSFAADEIINSDQKAYTGNNEKNSLKGKIKIIVDPYLTDTDAWFMCDSRIKRQGKKFPLQAIYGAPFETEMEKVFGKSGAVHIRAYFRAIFGAFAWRGVAGTEGAT